MRAVAMVADDIDLAVGAQLAVSDPTRLRNPLRTPMWLDSIVITPQYLTTPQTSFGASQALGDLQIRLTLGREPLTNGFVPVMTLDKIPNVSRGFNPNVGVTTPQVTALGAWSYIWRFKRPLFVPANGYVVPEFFNTGKTQNVTYSNIVLTYRGRSLPAGFQPKEVHIPWNTAFVGAVRDLDSPADWTEQSKETDLVNPFDEPLKTSRMNGVVCVSGFPSWYTPTNNFFFIDQEYITVRMTDSMGGIIVRDPTPFGHLFQPLCASWPLSTVMQPHQNYLVMLDLNLNVSFAGIFASNKLQPLIAISGYRTKPIDKVQLA